MTTGPIMKINNAQELKEEGSTAHRNRLRRTDNPYLIKARLWDEGWLRREKVNNPEASTIPTFWKWLKEQ